MAVISLAAAAARWLTASSCVVAVRKLVYLMPFNIRCCNAAVDTPCCLSFHAGSLSTMTLMCRSTRGHEASLEKSGQPTGSTGQPSPSVGHLAAGTAASRACLLHVALLCPAPSPCWSFEYWEQSLYA
jgi:hypothetical protein